MNRPRLIAVLGGRECDETTYRLAYAVGKGIAESGSVLLCGGRTGVMEAACQGASEAGGLTVGILPGTDRRDANQYVQVAIPTGIGVARNAIIARACEAAVAIGGNYGTLSEIAYCLQFGVPVCTLSSWDEIPGVVVCRTPEEVLSFLFGREAREQAGTC